MPYHDQLLCLCTAAKSRMLNCSTEIQADFSLSWDRKKGNLEFSITWFTQLCSMCGCCNGKCVYRKSKCNESESIQNWFHKSQCKLGTQSAHWQTAVCWQQRHSVSPLTIKYVQTDPGGHWPLWKETARPHTVHTSFHVINVNGILASNETKLFIKFYFNWA